MDKKKLIIIITSVVIALVAAIVAIVIITGDDKTGINNTTGGNETNNAVPKEPAANTEDLKEKLEIAEVNKVTKDQIFFEEEAPVEEGDKVAVWVYSEPKFLGYFTVKIVNGAKVIDGLEEKLNELNLDAGKHNIAIATEKGESLGYVNIVVEESGTLQEGEVDKTVTKVVTEKEVINFKTETQKDTSKPAGTKEVIQQGVTGEKEVKYEVTYDENGTELSRVKIEEKVIKEAVNQIEKVGAVDYNLNTAMITGGTTGFLCLENQRIDGSYCDDSLMLPSFDAIVVDGTTYLACMDNDEACAALNIRTSIKVIKSGNASTAIINGKKYYVDGRAGGMPTEKLTQEDCNKYKLICGRW